jgi:hypothetical protein
MTTPYSKALSTIVCIGALAGLALSTAHAGDCESDRVLQYYERCYGPNGYCISCDRCCRNAQASCPPSRFWDICVYRACFPMSPWYSNPRDGIHYPAYGSKSPGCMPARNY